MSTFTGNGSLVRNGIIFGGGGSGGDTTEYMTQAEYEQITPVQDQLYGVSGANPINAIVVNDASNNTYQAWSGSKVNTQLGLKADKTQITNPNLIDNPWFTINQRGQNSYNAQGYTVDRWAMLGGAINYTLTIGSVNLTPLRNVYQPLDATTYGQFENTQYTFSAIIDDVLEAWTFTAYGDGTQHQQTFATSKELDFNFIENWGTGLHLAGFDLHSVTKAHTIKAVKLEKGSISTLALDTAPNYATELLKCQRYFYSFNAKKQAYSIIGNGSATSVNICRVNAFLPVAMRTTPAISINNLSDIVVMTIANISATPSNITIDGASGASGNVISMDFTITGGYTKGEATSIYGKNSAVISLSADL